MNDRETLDLGRRMSNCARRLALVMELPEHEQPKALLKGAMFCQARLCPFCEWRRSRAWKARLVRGLDALGIDQPKLRPVLLTLTVRNCPIEQLRETVIEMHMGFKRMTKCAFWPTDYWLRRTELTFPLKIAHRSAHGRDATTAPSHRLDRGFYEAHPHIHLLLMVPPSYFSHGYVKQSEWQKQWMMAARLDYAPVVDVRTITAKDGSRSGHNAYLTAAQEVCKYMTKADDLGALGADLPFVNDQIKGLRMIAASGKLSPYVHTGEIEPEELTDQADIDGSEIPSAECLALWSDYLLQYEITPLA